MPKSLRSYRSLTTLNLKSIPTQKSEETILATNATSTFRTYATRKRKYSETLEAKDMVRKFLTSQYDIVQGYKVKQSVAAILKAIFKKYGDIASECVFKTVSMRESILEMVCEVFKQIQTNDITTIISKMGEIECNVSDAEAANINVSWLRFDLKTNLKWNKSQKRVSFAYENESKHHFG
ncbi:phospholipase-like protein [Tanacetum coccineum]|uniref:Phospholipase-like protein n=1 Tax=Tanacetum coccineum TaxID=301880 RepID=A0ABQ5IBG6_9ASTR